jgi:hypothetical protein
MRFVAIVGLIIAILTLFVELAEPEASRVGRSETETHHTVTHHTV